jgi:hypothetical protein
MYGLAMINWVRVASTLALVALLASGLWKIHHMGVESGRAEVQAQWNLARLAQADADKLTQARTRQRERALQDDADNLRKTKDEQIKKLNRSLTAALDGLRNRPERPAQSSVPSDPGTGGGCYPSQLYREDAAVAVELAGEADQLRIHLERCQAAYESVRRSWGKTE